ncbi:hypothetical protein ACHWQZ_G017244 [Mnemiopsis leidyi]
MTNGKPTRRGGGSNRGTPSRRGQGTPKSSTKVTARKTTAKEKTDPITTTDVSPEKCPCGQSDTSSWVLRCIKSNKSALLSSLISDTDRISSGCDEIARRVVDIDLTDISSGIAHLNIQQDQTSKIIKSVTSKLEQLSAPAQHAAPIMHIPAACDRPEPSAEPVHIIDQHAEILPKFIGDSEEQAILNFLLAHDTQFKAENGHSVLSFGHPYSYVGSKSTSNPPELPEVLQPLVNKLNIIQKRECGSRDHLRAQCPGINVPARAPVQNVFAQRANANDEHHWRLLFEQTQKQANVIEGILAELKDLRSTVKKAAPVEEAAPAEEAAQVEEAAPAEEAAPLEQAAPVEAAPAEEAAPV